MQAARLPTRRGGYRSPPTMLLGLTGLAAATAGLLLGAPYTGGR